ncbi:MAG: adenylosuccinate synthase, partial [Chloroflexi bacterium]|nr:adenylosuccinate synthase [Chloroflexota bacterium]
MPAIAVIGGQWGDEGKGKIIDLLSRQVQMVVRFSGGSNAGHTVVNELGEFRMHLIPSGIFHPGVTCVIGNGVVLDCDVLSQEIGLLASSGIPMEGRLFISDKAHLVMPYHIQMDALEEKRRGAQAIGTTLRGIGPAYADKVGRVGIRTGDLVEPQELQQRLESILDYKNTLLTQIYGTQPLSLEEVYSRCLDYGHRLRPYLRATEVMVSDALAAGQAVLLEGAQGSLLDVDFGTYPYVTSSSPLAAGACLGAGISPRHIDRVLGVFKAYTTRVGSGPLPTEMEPDTGELVRERASEYGATTGRPRRCGWFDAVLGHYSARLNGFDGIAVTRLDVLDTLPSIKVCTAYRLNGQVLDYPPVSVGLLAHCLPVYEELPGWLSSTGDCRTFNQLPRAAQDYLRRLEELLDVPIDLVSVGAH